jgi:hypothetical protein
LSKTIFSEASFYCVDRCPGTPPVADADNKVEMPKAATAAARQACPATGIGGSCIGTSMTIRCAAVIFGGKEPLVVLLTSNCADGAGVVPIPTLCACTIGDQLTVVSKHSMNKHFAAPKMGSLNRFLFLFR